MVVQIINKVFTIVVRQEDLKPGDHICTYRLYGLYIHHDTYLGEGDVIHFTRVGVKKTHLDYFWQEREKLHFLHLYAYGWPMLGFMLTRWGTCTTLANSKLPQEVVNKVCKLYEGSGFGEYNLINNNCEHFALFCRIGIRASTQTTFICACERMIKKAKQWAIKFLQTN